MLEVLVLSLKKRFYERKKEIHRQIDGETGVLGLPGVGGPVGVRVFVIARGQGLVAAAASGEGWKI